MTSETFTKGLALFTSTFPNVDITKERQDVWFALLKDLPDTEYLYAITKICNDRSEWYPNSNFVAVVRDQLKGNMDTQALLAWGMAKKAMAQHGAMASVQFEDPVIHSVIEIMGGWVQFCREPVTTWMEKGFIEKYKLLCGSPEHPKYLQGEAEIHNRIKFPKFVKPPVLIGKKQTKQLTGGE